MMAAMGLLGACAEADEQQKAQVGEAVTIQLTANVASETLAMGDPSAWTRDAWDAYQSRALTRGIQETTLINGQKVYLWADKGTAGTYAFLQAWNLTSNGSGGLTGSTKYYPSDGDGLTFRAVHGNFSTTPTEGTAIGTLTHTVLADQSATGNYEKSDLMYGEGTGSWESAGTVNFIHKLSKIEVNLTPGIGLIPSDMTDATVQIRGVKPTVSINAQTGDLGSASGTAVTITARHTGNGTFEAVIPPQTASSGMLTVTIGDVTATIPNAVATFASNSKYVYNVKCTNKDKHLNPLWYVAENNVKSYNSSTKVVTLETNPAAAGSSYCYKWYDAMAYFANQGASYDTYWIGDITDGSTGFKYHLPCRKEWLSIIPALVIPSDIENIFATSDNDPFVTSGLYTENSCIFGYNAETQAGRQYKSYWSNYDATNRPLTRYAIRFLGTRYCSVWKYQLSGYVLTITAKLIDYIAEDDTSLSSKLNSYMSQSDSWWNTNDEGEGAIQRKLYEAGYRYNSQNGGTGVADVNINEAGRYWSCSTETATGNGYSSRIYFTNLGMAVDYTDKKWGHTVRLFRNEGVGVTRLGLGVTLANSSPGFLVCSDGKAYDLNYKSHLASGVKVAGVVVYKSGTSGYAVSLFNVGGSASSDGTLYTYANRTSGMSSVTAVSGRSWVVGTYPQYAAAFNNNYTTFNSYITAAGGRAMGTLTYWCNDIATSNFPWFVYEGGQFAYSSYMTSTNSATARVRPMIAF
ncbi:hypothetical protein SAMN04487827_0651 [Prevotella sp. khp7]|nr:hypothetical protein SAMN04487827_0651 [Prevotella sp. khp7]